VRKKDTRSRSLRILNADAWLKSNDVYSRNSGEPRLSVNKSSRNRWFSDRS